MIEVVPARPNHIGTIARRMREIDVLECYVGGYAPKSALRVSLISSTIAWTVMIDGRPEAMMGASPLNLLDGTGRPWLLMTGVAGKHAISLVRLGRIYTEAMHRHYNQLENWVHADNITTIRWLSRLGYAVGPVDVIRSQPMRPFARHR